MKKEIIFAAVFYLSMFTAIALVAWQLIGCTLTPLVPMEDPTNDPNDCAAACDNLAILKCPGWRGSEGPDGKWQTPDDVSCQVVCEDVVINGRIPLNQLCISRAGSCEKAAECAR